MQTVARVSQKFTLTIDRTERLKRLAEARRISESEVVEKALDVYFDLAGLFEPQEERRGWHRLSERSLQIYCGIMIKTPSMTTGGRSWHSRGVMSSWCPFLSPICELKKSDRPSS